jgi:hypothetical protein
VVQYTQSLHRTTQIITATTQIRTATTQIVTATTKIITATTQVMKEAVLSPKTSKPHWGPRNYSMGGGSLSGGLNLIIHLLRIREPIPPLLTSLH